MHDRGLAKMRISTPKHALRLVLVMMPGVPDLDTDWTTYSAVWKYAHFNLLSVICMLDVSIRAK